MHDFVWIRTDYINRSPQRMMLYVEPDGEQTCRFFRHSESAARSSPLHGGWRIEALDMNGRAQTLRISGSLHRLREPHEGARLPPDAPRGRAGAPGAGLERDNFELFVLLEFC